MTFDEVGAPARLSGGLSPATNIPVVHTLLMAIQSTFEPEKPRKRYDKNGGGGITAIILVRPEPIMPFFFTYYAFLQSSFFLPIMPVQVPIMLEIIPNFSPQK